MAEPEATEGTTEADGDAAPDVDGDGEIVFDDEPTGAPMEQVYEEVEPLAGTVIPKEDRQVPRTVETIVTEEDGSQHPLEGVEPYFWGRAHHNQPGFVQTFVREDEDRPRGLMIGESGWIPNNEEGVNAVTIGFVEVVEPPKDAPPMPDAPRVAVAILDL